MVQFWFNPWFIRGFRLAYRMTRVEEVIAVSAALPQARRALTTVARMGDWVAPDITVVPLSRSPTLLPGDRIRLDVVGGLHFEYVVEAMSDREVVFAFTGPWSGRERWSFVADGADTLVRRVYEMTDASVLTALAWATIGRVVVSAHYKLELGRFRAVVESEPGVRAEIEPRAANAPRSGGASFPIDDG